MPRGEKVKLNGRRFREFCDRRSDGSNGLPIVSKTASRIFQGVPIHYKTAASLFETLAMPAEFFLSPDLFDYRDWSSLYDKIISQKCFVGTDAEDERSRCVFRDTEEVHRFIPIDDELRLPDIPVVKKNENQLEVSRKESLLPKNFFLPLVRIIAEVWPEMREISFKGGQIERWNDEVFIQRLFELGLDWIQHERDCIKILTLLGDLLETLTFGKEKETQRPKGQTSFTETLIIADGANSFAPVAEAFAQYVDLGCEAEILVEGRKRDCGKLENGVDAGAAFLRLLSVPASRVYVKRIGCLEGKKRIVFTTSHFEAARFALQARFKGVSSDAFVVPAQSSFSVLTFRRPGAEGERLWKKVIAEYLAIARLVYCE